MAKARSNGPQFGDLAADMHVDAGDFYPRQRGGERIDFAGLFPVNAELVVLLAGGDLGVRAGIDVRIDPEGYTGGFPGRNGTLRQGVEFGDQFDIEAQDVRRETGIEFLRLLAYARKHDLLRRHAGLQRPGEFAARNHIGARAQTRERCDNGLVGIGLERIADQRIDIGEGRRKDVVVPLKRGSGIAIEGGADRLRNRAHRHVLGEEFAVPVFEMVHGVRSRRGARLLDEEVQDEGTVLFHRLHRWPVRLPGRE